MPKDTGEFIISKSMNLRLPPIFGYTEFLFIPRQVRFSQSLSHFCLACRKTIPITGRASSFLVFLEFSKTKQRGGGTEQQRQTYQFTQGYNILH